MNLIILAAGKGTRLLPLTKNTPKSLIDLGDGTTLLERQINNAVACNAIDKVYVVTGYRSAQIEARIEQLSADIPVEIVYNPFFDISNNLLSLWCANYIMDGKDFIITNGDNIYKTGIYDQISAGIADTIQLTIDYKDHYDDDDMKVQLQSGQVQRVSKQIEIEAAEAESVGLVMIRGEQKRARFRRKLLEMVQDLENRNRFWLEIFNALVADGEGIDICEIDPDDWDEIDFHPDVESVRSAVFKKTF